MFLSPRNGGGSTFESDLFSFISAYVISGRDFVIDYSVCGRGRAR